MPKAGGAGGGYEGAHGPGQRNCACTTVWKEEHLRSKSDAPNQRVPSDHSMLRLLIGVFAAFAAGAAYRVEPEYYPTIHYLPKCVENANWHDMAAAITTEDAAGVWHHAFQGCPPAGWHHGVSRNYYDWTSLGIPVLESRNESAKGPPCSGYVVQDADGQYYAGYVPCTQKEPACIRLRPALDGVMVNKSLGPVPLSAFEDNVSKWSFAQPVDFNRPLPLDPTRPWHRDNMWYATFSADSLNSTTKGKCGALYVSASRTPNIAAPTCEYYDGNHQTSWKSLGSLITVCQNVVGGLEIDHELITSVLTSLPLAVMPGRVGSKCVSPSQPSGMHILVENGFGIAAVYRGALSYTDDGPRLVPGALNDREATIACQNNITNCSYVPFLTGDDEAKVGEWHRTGVMTGLNWASWYFDNKTNNFMWDGLAASEMLRPFAKGDSVDSTGRRVFAGWAKDGYTQKRTYDRVMMSLPQEVSVTKDGIVVVDFPCELEQLRTTSGSGTMALERDMTPLPYVAPRPQVENSEVEALSEGLVGLEGDGDAVTSRGPPRRRRLRAAVERDAVDDGEVLGVDYWVSQMVSNSSERWSAPLLPASLTPATLPLRMEIFVTIPVTDENYGFYVNPFFIVSISPNASSGPAWLGAGIVEVSGATKMPKYKPRAAPFLPNPFDPSTTTIRVVFDGSIATICINYRNFITAFTYPILSAPVSPQVVVFGKRPTALSTWPLRAALNYYDKK